METIGERLRLVRLRKGLTQAKLAEMAGVSSEVISKTENNRNKNPKQLPQIAQALGMDANEFITGLKGTEELTQEGVDIAIKWQNMSALNRRAILAALEAMSDQEASNNPSPSDNC